MAVASDVLLRPQSAFGPRVLAEIVFSPNSRFHFSLLFRFQPAWRETAVASFERLAARGFLPYLAAGLFPVCLPLLAICWQGTPEPMMRDEFNHLPLADTLLHGRLANPPHPFWSHLETIYVLQQPAYLGLAQTAIIGSGFYGVALAALLLTERRMDRQ